MHFRKCIFRAPWVWILLLALQTSSCSKMDRKGVATDGIDYWTCTMHPSVHLRLPGKCPICGMDLVPVVKNEGAPGSLRGAELSQFVVPIERQQQFGVTYKAARRRPLRLEVRSVGTLELDQAKIFEYVAPVEEYVRELKVTSPGERVSAGEVLLIIYDSALRAAELQLASLLQARMSGTQASFDQQVDAARHRLKSWNVGQTEMDELERTMRPSDQLILRAPFDGIVDQMQAKVGQSVQPGDKLLRVVDLSKLWLWADFYENEIGLLKEGQRMRVALPAFPDQALEGSVSVISPTVDPIKRTVRVRIDLPNPVGRLLPGMYANVAAEIDCGEGLTVPVDAVLPTGSRMLVFLDRGAGRLEPRFIQVGRQFADRESNGQEEYYEVLAGLQEGDRIVSSANFLIAAESQIRGAVKGWESGPELDGAPPLEKEMNQEHPAPPGKT
jgi:membrane fusion protein, copper/silver efflux system